MSNRKRGFSAWLIITLVSIFLGMLFILFYGTGVFRNWGKRGQEQEAEIALYKALVRLDDGKLGDMAGSFQPHQAGRVANETYQFIRTDLLEAKKLGDALRNMPTAMPADANEARQNREVLKHGRMLIRAALDERKIRGGKLLLTLRNAGSSSDRLQARYLSTQRDFEETDNLFGAGERLIEIKFDRFSYLIEMLEVLIANEGDWRLDKGGAIRFLNANSQASKRVEELQAKLILGDREAMRVQRITETAVAAERESMRRRLGL